MDNVERAIKSLDWLKVRLDRCGAQLDSNAVTLAMNLLEGIRWKAFQKEPPQGKKTILLWLDHKHLGFATTAHVEEDGSVWWWNYSGRTFLTDPSGVFWKDIQEP